MRRFVFFSLLLVLAALIAARSALPAAQPAALLDGGSDYGYNVLDLAPPLAPETAGSTMTAEMTDYFFSREPTAKSELTGRLAGKSLVLVCADHWNPDPTDRRLNPTLHRLWKEGVRFSQVYRPDWYQDEDGRVFALLSGLMPTRVDDKTALAYAGEQHVALPFALARRFAAAAGYDTRACIPGQNRRDAFSALGFTTVTVSAAPAADTVDAMLADLPEDAPFLLFFLWEDNFCEEALARLTEGLETAGRSGDTVLCLFTGNGETYHAQLFLWDAELAGREASVPCSELDLTPTLLDLFGVPFDARFLSGRDIFAPAPDPGTASDTAPLVSLYGSAYSDWISDAGSYIAAESVFWPRDEVFDSEEAVILYAQTMRGMAYDRYVFARRVMETNFFALLSPP